MGFDPLEPELFWIAKEGFYAPLPKDWVRGFEKKKIIVFIYNIIT